MTTVGGRGEKVSFVDAEPIRAVSSSFDDLHELLGRSQAFEHFGAERALLHLADELFDDLVVDVGLEQRKADLASGALDVLLRELALAS